MKKFLVGLAAVFVAVGAQAQGFVNFNNIGTPIQSSVTGDALGAGWTVDLLVGDTVIASTPVVGGGTFLGPNPVDLGTAAEVEVTVRAWPTASGGWGTASSTEGSEILEPVSFMAQGGNADAAPPEVPTALGFPGGTTSVVVIPEPSTIALGVLGLGALALRRRRNA